MSPDTATPVPPHSASSAITRRLAVGAEIHGSGVHFRVWAPDRQRVAVVIDGRDTPLASDADGYFSGFVDNVSAGARYLFRLDDDGKLYPDPASRSQPEGPHGSSEVIDPSHFVWTDGHWTGCTLDDAVIYEMHIGTFTQAGTYAAAGDELEALRALGVTVIELMPIAEWVGRFGWGYDGVNWFAPTHLYGSPDDLRAFVDRAHALGLGVILDVVYNHFGPDGNYAGAFSRDYFSRRYKNEWGDPLNFDGPNAHGTRELVLSNVQYWIEEFHVDGYRFDAMQQIFDDSEEHILAAATRRAREAAHARGRSIILTGENEVQDARVMRPLSDGGYGFDAQWSEDFHHAAVVAMTGRREAYYTDYNGSPQELISAAKYGYLFQGQHYVWQQKSRGTPALDREPAQFIFFIENHDQVPNSARGQRLHQLTTGGRYRAMTAFLLLMPGTPLLFQGQEFASTRPFLFFADHEGQLARDVRAGRAEFLSQFPSVAQPDVQAMLPDPADPEIFARCKLDFSERERHAPVLRLHRDLLTMRRETPAFRTGRRHGLDGCVLGPEALAIRRFDADAAQATGTGDRLILMNLGRDLRLRTLSDPLLAPPEGMEWTVIWSSEDPRYGGNGVAPLDGQPWQLPGHELRVLAPVAAPAPAPVSSTQARESESAE